MKLKDYIKLVLENSPKDTEVYFEIALDCDGEVTDFEVGNKIKFTLFNRSKTK